jgi:hypothetical protein
MTNPGPDTVRLLADAGAVLQPGFSGLTAPDWVRRHLDSGELGGVPPVEYETAYYLATTKPQFTTIN